jgi:hypothetical protein
VIQDRRVGIHRLGVLHRVRHCRVPPLESA